MVDRLRLKLPNKWVVYAGVVGVGLLPCPDCAVPLATHIWPVAGAVWLFRRWRRRGEAELDLLIAGDLIERAAPPSEPDPGGG